MTPVSSIEQLAGETPEQHLQRLEGELVEAEQALKRATEEHVALKEERDTANAALVLVQEQLEFLRSQISDLALSIDSPSAPTRKSEMFRLLQGWLDEQDWRNRTWRGDSAVTVTHRRKLFTYKQVREVVRKGVSDCWPATWPKNEHTSLLRDTTADTIASLVAKELAGSVFGLSAEERRLLADLRTEFEPDQNAKPGEVESADVATMRSLLDRLLATEIRK